MIWFWKDRSTYSKIELQAITSSSVANISLQCICALAYCLSNEKIYRDLYPDYWHATCTCSFYVPVFETKWHAKTFRTVNWKTSSTCMQKDLFPWINSGTLCCPSKHYFCFYYSFGFNIKLHVWDSFNAHRIVSYYLNITFLNHCCVLIANIVGALRVGLPVLYFLAKDGFKISSGVMIKLWKRVPALQWDVHVCRSNGSLWMLVSQITGVLYFRMSILSSWKWCRNMISTRYKPQ